MLLKSLIRDFFQFRNIYINMIKLILKGFIVGVGKIIPGVSGSLLAFSLGIYEDLIKAVTEFFSNPKKHLRLLFNFGIGLFLAIFLFSKFILFLMHAYYNETMVLFLGMILGTLFHFKDKLVFNKKNILLFLITLIVFSVFSRCLKFDKFIYVSNIKNYLYVVLLGGIDAFTSIVPGISGTAIYMLLGVYEFVLSILGNPNSYLFLLYGIGLVVGILCTCLLMNYLLKKRKDETYSCVFALMIASIFLLIKSFNIFKIYFIIIFIVGVIIGYLFDN